MLTGDLAGTGGNLGTSGGQHPLLHVADALIRLLVAQKLQLAPLGWSGAARLRQFRQPQSCRYQVRAGQRAWLRPRYGRCPGRHKALRAEAVTAAWATRRAATASSARHHSLARCRASRPDHCDSWRADYCCARAGLAAVASYVILLLVSAGIQSERSAEREKYLWWTYRQNPSDDSPIHPRGGKVTEPGPHCSSSARSRFASTSPD